MPCCRGLPLERVGQSGQQVVVAQDSAAALADFQFGQHGPGEVDACRGAGSRLRIPRTQFGARVTGHLAGQGEGLLVVDLRFLPVPAEPGQIEIIDDLGDQIVETLDEFHPGIGIAGHSQRGQHDVAELVDGGDGGGVEIGQRIGEVGPPSLVFLGIALQQPGDHLVVSDQCGIAETCQGMGDLTAHPLTQFLGGGPAEGDQQHLVESGHPLGEVAGDQRGQGEGLAGPRAGLQDGGRTRVRQGAEQIETAGFVSRFHG